VAAAPPLDAAEPPIDTGGGVVVGVLGGSTMTGGVAPPLPGEVGVPPGVGPVGEPVGGADGSSEPLAPGSSGCGSRLNPQDTPAQSSNTVQQGERQRIVAIVLHGASQQVEVRFQLETEPSARAGLAQVGTARIAVSGRRAVEERVTRLP
jgi:hypothetical protein